MFEEDVFGHDAEAFDFTLADGEAFVVEGGVAEADDDVVDVESFFLLFFHFYLDYI